MASRGGAGERLQKHLGKVFGADRSFVVFRTARMPRGGASSPLSTSSGDAGAPRPRRRLSFFRRSRPPESRITKLEGRPREPGNLVYSIGGSWHHAGMAPRRWLIWVLLATSGLGQSQPTETSKASQPAQRTSEEDHRAMLDRLGIPGLRPGAHPNDPASPNAVNYDESRANPYPCLPDPLLTQDRRQVTHPTLWWDTRRPELLELFDREVYGRVPQGLPAIDWRLREESEGSNRDVRTRIKKLTGVVDNSGFPSVTVEMDLTLVTPAEAPGPVPVMLELGFEFRRPGHPSPVPEWQHQVLSRGWGYAILLAYSVQPDSGAGLAQGIIGLANQGRLREPDAWGALRAWAWGASRALDYLEADPAVDGSRVGIEGVSRFGKAALVAMAYDPRFAVGFIASSGAAGAKLHRRNFGEIVENVASVAEYHWMAGNYLKYAGPLTWDDLPVDSHQLIALCAPRPVFISVGSPEVEGQWIDARGMFLAAVAAGPVYELLGKRGLGTTEFPPIETALVDGALAFRQHSGGHTAGPNWPTFLEWAAHNVGLPPSSPGETQ